MDKKYYSFLVSIFIVGIQFVAPSLHAQKAEMPTLLKEWTKNPSKATLPDYSYAGYNAGEKLPPRRHGLLPLLNVESFGAIPNDSLDDIKAIQAAVDSAAKLGGAVIKFQPGIYDFDVDTVHQYINVMNDSIILSGYGDGVDGTHFIDHHGSSWPNPAEKWLAGRYPSFIRIGPVKEDVNHFAPENLLSTVNPAARHSTTITVKDASKMKVGMVLLLTQKDKAGSTSLLDHITLDVKPAFNLARTDGNFAYKMRNLVRIKSVQGNTIELDAPLLLELKEEWQPQLWAQPHLLRFCGVENIRFITKWNKEFHHHKDSEHDSGWDGVQLSSVVEGWVRNCTFMNVTTGMSFIDCLYATIYDCQIVGNRGHNGILVSGNSTRNLLFNLQSENQMHTWGLLNMASGTVFHNCITTNEGGGVDCHGGLGIYNLADNLHGSVYASGGASKNTPPAIGRGLTFWNWRVGYRHPYNGRIVDNTLDTKATPGLLVFGYSSLIGVPLYYKTSTSKYETKEQSSPLYTIQGINKLVEPYSLYRYQRQRRLGSPLPSE